MAIEWYIKQGEQEKGPLTSADIRKLAAAGELQPSDLVRKSDMTKWAKATAIKGLFPTESAPAPTSSATPKPSPASTPAPKLTPAPRPAAAAPTSPAKTKPATKPAPPAPPPPPPPAIPEAETPEPDAVDAPPKRRSRLLWCISAAVILVAIGGGAYYYFFILNDYGSHTDFNKPFAPSASKKLDDPLLTTLQDPDPERRRRALIGAKADRVSDASRGAVRQIILDTLADPKYKTSWRTAVDALGATGEPQDLHVLQGFIQTGEIGMRCSALASAMLLDPENGVKLFEPQASNDVCAKWTLNGLVNTGARCRPAALAMLKSAQPKCRACSIELLKQFGTAADIAAINHAKASETDQANLPGYELAIASITKRNP